MKLINKASTLIIIFIISSSATGQSKVDSLSQLNMLTEIYEKYIENVEDSVLAKKYAFQFKSKAVELNVDEYICYGYYYLANSSSGEEKIEHLDTIIYQVSSRLEQRPYVQFPELAYESKADFLYENLEYDKSLDVLLEGLEIATQNQKTNYINRFNLTIGLIKSERINQEKEALKIFKQVYLYFAQNEKHVEEETDYLSSIFALADIYRKLNLNDSASYFNKLGFKESLKLGDSTFKNYFIFNEGLNKSFEGNSRAAIDSILPSISFLKSQNDFGNIGLSQYALGKSYLSLGMGDKALKYFAKMDSLFKSDNVFNIEQRPGFEYLVNYHKSKNDKISQLEAIETLVKLDSIYMTQYKDIRDLMDVKFDRMNLLREREDLIMTLDEQNKKSRKTIYLSVALGILFLSSTIVYYLKQRAYKSRFDEIMNSGSMHASAEETKDESDGDIGVPDKIVKQILMNLSKFEKEEGYLNSNMNTHVLAERISTNSKYLSKVINQHKGQSIITYINNLRIDYTIKKLKTDKQFRNYTVKAIAEEMGFNNPNSFSTAFEKRTKLKPSYFIKRISSATNS
ncbi:helix-turn-helix domain-containing protein [Flagellimonas onchidii]|uniref:helix-turn-helix domain-containing protein n=1 Tax=Flagellimonas onchidii TaxID=2562684 RepID=UPI0010A61970|nr:helix-turn-helix domain-containing protein [Allomuricauda onchidii]